jgi:hypothetical protein
VILLLLGLADHDNYHEYCRLLGRFRVNYQVIYCIITFFKSVLSYVLFSCSAFSHAIGLQLIGLFAWTHSHVCRDCHLMLYSCILVHVHGMDLLAYVHSFA